MSSLALSTKPPASQDGDNAAACRELYIQRTVYIPAGVYIACRPRTALLYLLHLVHLTKLSTHLLTHLRVTMRLNLALIYVIASGTVVLGAPMYGPGPVSVSPHLQVT